MKSHEWSQPVCVICGSRKIVEGNHIGGQNHIAWMKMPFCKTHHRRFHILLEQIGVDLRYTSNPLERLNRASKAITICRWVVDEAMGEEISRKTGS